MIKTILSSVLGQITLALIGLAVISAYSLEPQAAVLPNKTLAGTQWQLQALVDERLQTERPITLEFDQLRLSGFAGCNRFSGNYTLGTDASLGVGTTSATKMACNEQRSQLEQRFLQKLQVVHQFSLNNGQLQLLDAQHKVLMTFNSQNLTNR
jgi:heat shock protein HslJ